MILDHEWIAAAIAAGNALTEHGTGNLSLTGLILYVLIREGLPIYRRKRNGGHNPGNHLLAARLAACEEAIGEVKQSCTRSETLWEGQKEFNKRMEKHVEKIHARIDAL